MNMDYIITPGGNRLHPRGATSQEEEMSGVAGCTHWCNQLPEMGYHYRV